MISVLKDAFKTAFKKPLTWIALVAVPLIVACFGLLYFGTFISPDERIKDLPIAVINKDSGCTIDDTEHNFGSELSDAIIESDKAKWTGAQSLNQGLETLNSGIASLSGASNAFSVL